LRRIKIPRKYFMKKFFIAISLFCLLLAFSAPISVKADGLVPCDGIVVKCEWAQLKQMLQGILNFIVFTIATPLATLALVVGGIILLTSAGNPGLAGLGKQIIWAAIIGLLLALCSVAIVNFILQAIGSSQTV